jgi:hypothetical protein
MALIVPQHYAQVIHSFRLTGDPDPYAVTYGVKVTDPPVVSTVNDLASELDNIFVARVMPAMGPSLTLAHTEIQWQAAALPASREIGIVSSNSPGTNAGATAFFPPNSALLIHKRTSLAGRHGQGRLYMPAVAEGWADNVGNVLGSVITDFTAKFESVRTDILASPDFDYMCLFHDSVSTTTIPGPTAISSLSCDPVVATQRRRLRH